MFSHNSGRWSVITLNRIDEESEEINKLVLSSKNYDWNEVWKILGPGDKPRRAYLLNCIPDGRRWGVLHQAAFWNRPDIVDRLLNYPGSDPCIITKNCTWQGGETGRKTATQIARANGYSRVVDVLARRLSDDVHWFVERPTFAPYDTGIENRGMGIIAITLAAYKKTFHPDKIDKGVSVTTVLRDIFWQMNASPTFWQHVKASVCDTLFMVNETSSKFIKEHSTDRESFYKAIINAYTKESTYLYDNVNTALRKQTETNYLPSSIDLAMGPYIAVYKMLLLFWNGLPKESSTTYRKMLLSKEHTDKYEPQLQFSWHGFVSSSVELEKAIPFPTCEAEGEFNVMFTIDNSARSLWQPRDIEKFAEYHERERVYPAGARFQVTGRTRKLDMTHVQLKLIN